MFAAHAVISFPLLLAGLDIVPPAFRDFRSGGKLPAVYKRQNKKNYFARIAGIFYGTLNVKSTIITIVFLEFRFFIALSEMGIVA